MKKQTKRFYSRLKKLHKLYGDVILDETQIANKYHKIKKRK